MLTPGSQAKERGIKMLNLSELTTAELEALAAAIKKEIASRKVETQKKYLYTHACKYGSNYHLKKYKHWSKLVTAVDTAKTNGYAFVGDFLNVSAEHLLPIGSIIVEVCDEDITAYKITDSDTREKIAEGKTRSMYKVIKLVADIMEA
jgi:hypothetical protein